MHLMFLLQESLLLVEERCLSIFVEELFETYMQGIFELIMIKIKEFGIKLAWGIRELGIKMWPLRIFMKRNFLEKILSDLK